LGLTNFLAQATGPLGKMIALQRIYEAVRFSDAEMGQIKVTPMGGGLTNFEPPSLGFGHVQAAVEDGDAMVLQQEIEGCQQFRLTDLGWVNHIKAELAKPGQLGR